MKKLTAILLTACVMSVAFIGCNDTSTATKKETKTTTEKTSTPPASKTP